VYQCFHYCKIPNGYCNNHGIVLPRIDGLEVTVHKGYPWHPSQHVGICVVYCLNFPQMLLSRRCRRVSSYKSTSNCVDDFSYLGSLATSPPWGPRTIGSLPSLFVSRTSPRASSWTPLQTSPPLALSW